MNISLTGFYPSGREKCTKYWKHFHFRRYVKHGFQLTYFYRTRHCSTALLEAIRYLFRLNRSRNMESRGRNSCKSLRKCGTDSVFGIASGYGLDGPGIESPWGEIFRTCPDRPWGPPSLLYNGYRVFPGGKEWPGRDVDPSLPSNALVKKE